MTRRLSLALVVTLAGAGCSSQGNTPSPAATQAQAGAGTTAAATPGPTLASVARATADAEATLPDYVRTVIRGGIEDGRVRLPFDVAVASDGSLYVSDSTGVQKLTPGGDFSARVDPDDLIEARGLAVGPDDRLFVTGFRAEVRVYAPDGTRLANIGTPGDGPGQFSQPVDVSVGPTGDIFVVDKGNRTVQAFASDGAFLRSYGEQGRGDGRFSLPWSAAEDSKGRVYVSAADDYLILRFAGDGAYIDTFGQAHQTDVVWQTASMAFDDQGNLYAIQVPNHTIQSFDVDGPKPLMRWEFGSLGRGPRQFSSPSGLTIVGSKMFVADTGNDRVVESRLK